MSRNLKNFVEALTRICTAAPLQGMACQGTHPCLLLVLRPKQGSGKDGNPRFYYYWSGTNAVLRQLILYRYALLVVGR